jgi:integrase
MPVAQRLKPWEITARNQIRQLGSKVGFTVLENRGRVQLKWRITGQPIQTVVLPFKWADADWGDAYVRIRNIYKLTQAGHDLKAAATIAGGKAPTINRDWPSALTRFQDQKQNHGRAISQKTWLHSYEPVLIKAVGLLTSKKPPLNSPDLIDACIREWKTGSRMRQIRAQSLAQFLKHCVNREGFPETWLPPSDLRVLVGEKRPTEAVNQKGDPFTHDQQIINLLAALPADEAGRRWADAIRLMAELGLRPIELMHLKVRTAPETGKPHWWCTYQKRSGGGTTQPRRIYPLPLVSADGELQQWYLLQRWQARLIELPSLRSGNGAGDCVATYLSRQTAWRSLRAEMLELESRRLVPYSFRHSYSLRGHQRNIDPGAMAQSMGHSLEVHLRSYPWASARNTSQAFDRALEMVVAQPV